MKNTQSVLLDEIPLTPFLEPHKKVWLRIITNSVVCGTGYTTRFLSLQTKLKIRPLPSLGVSFYCGIVSYMCCVDQEGYGETCEVLLKQWPRLFDYLVRTVCDVTISEENVSGGSSSFHKRW